MQQPRKEPEYLKYFSNELSEEIKYIKEELSEELYFNEITPDIFIASCLSKTTTLLYRLVCSFVSVTEICEICDSIMNTLKEEFIVPVRRGRKIEFSSKMNSILQLANEERKKLGHPLITTDHILLATLSQEEKDAVSNRIANLGINYEFATTLSKEIHTAVNETVLSSSDFSINEQASPNNSANEPKINKVEPVKNHTTLQYCKSLQTIDGCENYPDIVGRDKEVSELIKILSRKTLNNALIVGDTGVGKTSIVKKFVNAIATNSVPPEFRRKEVLQFDYMSLISGTQMRGAFEERITKLTNDLLKKKNVILYIPSIHSILNGRMRDNYDFSGFLTSVFSSHGIMIIGETTHEEFHKTIESAPEIMNGFQQIEVTQPTIDETFEILKKIKHSFEEFHNVSYSDDILNSAIDLSKRYITEKQLPSSVIDIIDEAGSIKKTRNPLLSELVSCKQKENTLLLRRAIDGGDTEKELEQLKLKSASIEKQISNTRSEITLDYIRTAISEHTGIPITKVNTNDIKEISEINNIIKKVVVGQDYAVDSVCMAIKRSKIGLCQENRPILSAMFIGGTGTGKTLLAKTIAREIFGGDDALIRIDMSEYSDKTAVNKLIGSSAGYVGYENGGILTEAVKKRKNSVILIDEIEKSTDEVFNVFLQVLDEGFLSDNTGRKVDFRNTIILMTSNIGVRRSHDEHSIGFTTNSEVYKREIIEKEVKNKFSPEFLNRIDEIIYFNPLNEENFSEIINIELGKLTAKLKKIGYSISYDKSVSSFIMAEAMKAKEFGARPIARIIKKKIEDKIAALILEGEGTSSTFFAETINNEINVKKI